MVNEPTSCKTYRPIDTRILGWCDDEKVWKCGKFIEIDGNIWFKHEGNGPAYGPNEVSYWMSLPANPHKA